MKVKLIKSSENSKQKMIGLENYSNKNKKVLVLKNQFLIKELAMVNQIMKITLNHFKIFKLI